ncbi:MAG TPA: BTAD domain-containing putative transcriptional regulator, partial [Burkholderiaceae bacterium]|nr:BTAD domain-containing putative transcriptional regulator [Burkholderiaceae bacterium]
MDTAPPVAVATNAELRLQLLRTPQLWRGDRAVALNRLDAALLALLAHDGPTTRARALALLWPDIDAAAARNLLRQRLFRLRRAAGCEFVGALATRLALAEDLAHDLRDPGAALLDDPEAAAGELLGDFAYDELSEFRDWLEGARERWRARRREALRALARRFEQQGQPARAIALAERLVRDEPLREHAHRELIRLHYLCGDRNAARAALARLRAVLARELDAAPGAETEALAALVEASAALPEPAAARVVPVATLRPPRLIGRDAAWHTLESSWRDGMPALVLGEAGIGKSRLIDDFARAHGAVRVCARPGDAHAPFALLARLAAELGAPSPERWDAPRLTQALAPLQPAGIVLDDLHFADEASLELLPALLAAKPRPWVLAARAHELVAGADWLAELPVRIELAPLSAGSVHELLDSLGLPGIDAQAWSERVFRHSGGNPFFVLETVRALLEPGIGAGAWADTALPAPGTLQRLIAARLAKLSPAALKLARVAALAAADFSVDVAAAVLDQHPLDQLDAWRELEAADVVRGQGFAHDLIRQACRAAVPEALRAWLHGRIAAALEA